MVATSKTIGFLGTDLTISNTTLQNQLWMGTSAMSRKLDIHLVYFPLIRAFLVESNNVRLAALLKLINVNYLDGLIIWYGGIKEFLQNKHEEDRFLQAIQPLPIVTIGGDLDGSTNITTDNYRGMKQVVEHLIVEHNFRNIGFIRGPVGHPEAEQRYQGYQDALSDHQINLDMRLVAQGAFYFRDAIDMAQKAVEHWLQISDLKLDAIVGSSDYMAYGAIQQLQSRGLSVPGDIAVAGFDNVDDADMTTLWLTTVHQPFYQLGEYAADTLNKILGGGAFPDTVSIKPELIIRESCGCQNKSMELVQLPAIYSQQADSHDDNLPALAYQLNISANELKDITDLLSDTLEIKHHQTILSRLGEFIIRSANDDYNGVKWQNFISLLQKFSIQATGDMESRFFHSARVLVSEFTDRLSVLKRFQTNRLVEQLRSTIDRLSISFGQDVLIEALREQLLSLGFSTFYFAVYENPDMPEAGCNLMLAYDEKIAIDLPSGGSFIPLSRIIQTTLEDKDEAISVIVEPLYFREEQLGILILEAHSDIGMTSETLRIQVSNALQGSRLLQQVQNHANDLEIRVSERTRELTESVQQLKNEILLREEVEATLRTKEMLSREFQEKLKQLQELSLQLASISSFDELYKSIIVDGCSKLGYDRLSLLMLVKDEKSRVNRFGLNASGDFCFEYAITYAIEKDPVLSSQLLTDPESARVEEATNLRDFDGQIVGTGWHVVSGIWEQGRCVGWLAADNLFKGQSLKPYQVELLTIYSLTISNILPRKRAEAEINQLNADLEQRVRERTARLREINTQLEDFAHIVSHDLKAPLQGVSQLVTWLGEDYAQVFDDEGQKMLDILQRRTGHMSELIDGILSYSRAVQSKQEYHEADMNRVTDEVISGLVVPEHIKIEIENILPTLSGNIIGIKQVMQNLISNSIKFMDKDQGLIQISAEDREQDWLFSVRDNGPGIDVDHHEKIFQIFQRLEGVQHTEGTGIGLTVVKKIVDKWGGTIQVESVPGNGCTFYFTIPRPEDIQNTLSTIL